MGLRIDRALNEASADDIHAPASPIRVAVVRADEEAVIANHLRTLVRG